MWAKSLNWTSCYLFCGVMEGNIYIFFYKEAVVLSCDREEEREMGRRKKKILWSLFSLKLQDPGDEGRKGDIHRMSVWFACFLQALHHHHHHPPWFCTFLTHIPLYITDPISAHKSAFIEYSLQTLQQALNCRICELAPCLAADWKVHTWGSAGEKKTGALGNFSKAAITKRPGLMGNVIFTAPRMTVRIRKLWLEKQKATFHLKQWGGNKAL